jgi:hypothetical protein
LGVLATERTFDGAYTRTALNSIATGIFIYRVFQDKFKSIAFVYVAFGTAIAFVSFYRRLSSFSSSSRGLRRVHDEEVEMSTIDGGPGSSSNDDGTPKNYNTGVAVRLRSELHPVAMQTLKKRKALTTMTLTQQETDNTTYDSSGDDGVEVIVPNDPPRNKLPPDYFRWRQKSPIMQNKRYFYTSGTTNRSLVLLLLLLLRIVLMSLGSTVLFISLVVATAELIILFLLIFQVEF